MAGKTGAEKWVERGKGRNRPKQVKAMSENLPEKKDGKKPGLENSPEQASRSRSRCYWFYASALAVILLDQLSKRIAVMMLSYKEPLAVIKGFFALVMVNNTGASFGILKDATLFLILISVVVIAIIMYYRARIPEKPCIFLALLLGGVVGNLIDRVMHGFVIDFISLSFWPAFNVADIAITVGAAGLIVYFSFFTD